MHIHVRHRTIYDYSAPVRLAPHRLRLSPRGVGVDVLEETVAVDPAPRSRTETADLHGNRVLALDFDGETERFVVDSRFTVETHPTPTTSPSALPRLPWTCVVAEDFAAYRDDPDLDDAVRAFATDLAEASDGEPVAFLERLNHTLFERTDRYIRGSGYAQTPAETLARGSGACRDVTVLFMAAARSQGFAARFVSGYQARAETADGLRHLHAWPEVFLPGLGWRGYDPTHGLPVTDGHVAIGAGPDQLTTMPIEGGFYGTGVTSTLAYDVCIEAEE